MKPRNHFKNRAEQMHYLLNPRCVETATTASGRRFAIYDRGNFASQHMFEILYRNERAECWERVSDIYLDWPAVSREFNDIVAADAPVKQRETTYFITPTMTSDESVD